MAASPGDRQLRARLCPRSRIGNPSREKHCEKHRRISAAARTLDTVRTSRWIRDLRNDGHRDPAGHQVEGLVRGFPGGGSSPLRRMTKAPPTRGFRAYGLRAMTAPLAPGAWRRAIALERHHRAKGVGGRLAARAIVLTLVRLRVQSRAFATALETPASNVGPTTSRGGKTDVRPRPGARSRQTVLPEVARRPLGQDTSARKAPPRAPRPRHSFSWRRSTRPRAPTAPGRPPRSA